MFSKKSRTNGNLVSPVDGVTVALEDTGDDVFASKMVGDGVAVKPSGNVFVSPCGGIVQHVASSKHAYNITSDDGLEVLVHIGIDTVEMRGEGFTAKVKSGDRVEKGQVLCEADLEKIMEKGFSTVTPLIISNIGDVEFFDRKSGSVKQGEPLITYMI